MQRLPLPESLVVDIYKNYLNAFDKDVLTGETILVTEAKDFIDHMGDCFDLEPNGANNFLISRANWFNEDPDSPKPYNNNFGNRMLW